MRDHTLTNARSRLTQDQFLLQTARTWLHKKASTESSMRVLARSGLQGAPCRIARLLVESVVAVRTLVQGHGTPQTRRMPTRSFSIHFQTLSSLDRGFLCDMYSVVVTDSVVLVYHPEKKFNLTLELPTFFINTRSLLKVSPSNSLGTRKHVNSRFHSSGGRLIVGKLQEKNALNQSCMPKIVPTRP